MLVHDKESDLVEGVLFILPILGKDALASPSARIRIRLIIVLVV